MKARVDTQELRDAVAWVAGSVASRVYMPALAGVRIDAADGWLTVTSTDLEVWAEARIPANVATPGAVLAPSVLTPTVAAFRGKGATELAASDQLEITCGHTVVDLNTLNIEDFPTRPTTADGATFRLPATVAQQVAERVAPAAATNEDRVALLGIHCRVTDGTLLAAATDSYRLHTFTATLDGADDCTFLVPPSLWTRLAKLDVPAEVTVVEEGPVHVEAGDRTLIVQQIAAAFPSVDKLMPADDLLTLTWTVDVEPLNDALRRVVAVTAGRANTPVKIEISDRAATFTAGTESGHATDVVEVDHDLGDLDAWSVQVNPKFFGAGVAAVGTEQVTVRHNPARPLGPLVVGADTGFRALLMPMNPK